VDVLQLYRRQGRKTLSDLLLPDVLINASVLGLTSVLSLLLECMSDCEISHQFCEEMLRGAAYNLHESTTQLLLRWKVKPNSSVVYELAPSIQWTRPTDGSEETRLRIMTALLDAGANVTEKVIDECVVKRLRIIDLLEGRGANIRYCSSVPDLSPGTCMHGYSSACRAQGRQV
jgi:hypothetical protein